MSVVVSAAGTRGDVQPLAALGLALRRAGHEVVICAPLDFGEWVVSLGLDYRPIQVCMAESIKEAGNAPHKVVAAIGRLLQAEWETVSALPDRVDLYLGGGM